MHKILETTWPVVVGIQPWEVERGLETSRVMIKMASKRKMKAAEDEYQLKRLRNNEAVRKSREKARIKAQETTQRVQKLRQENEALEERMKLLKKELSFLKSVFIAHSGKGIKPG